MLGKTSSWVFISVIMAKGNWQRKWLRLWRGNCIFGTFFNENNGKKEKRKVKCHRLHVRRKIMENEENKGPIDKNVYEDQLMAFC